MNITLSQIRTDGGTQPREAINAEIVAEYAEAMAEGATFPPVTVYYDGADYWLADGFHRVNGARQAGLSQINAEVHQGSRRDAILHSVGANSSHGLRRTNPDKRRAVMALLSDSEWSEWSDREIARRCAVGNKMVSDLRNSICVNDTDKPTTRKVERNGMTYTQNTTNIGKRTREPEEVDDEYPDDDYTADDEVIEEWVDESGDDEEWEDDEIQFNPSTAPPSRIADMVQMYFHELSDELPTSSRHEIANVLVKYFRQLSIQYNRNES